MKFRYYIADLFDGSIKGTNDALDSETGEQITDYKRREIKEVSIC